MPRLFPIQFGWDGAFCFFGDNVLALGAELMTKRSCHCVYFASPDRNFVSLSIHILDLAPIAEKTNFEPPLRDFEPAKLRYFLFTGGLVSSADFSSF